ncbi:UDP-glucuronosyltransferase 2C1-like isoform X1 [Diadema antillarum]|uniref:UDP-glucuronosyltransferase 2C1-like isoform X1 n=1 Tax=Diadema antillarum TaxID=105358 RepID=UPI003A8461BB
MVTMAFCRAVGSKLGFYAFMLLGCIELPAVIAENILISAIYGEGSHFLAAASVGESLVERGHNITALISNAFEHRASDPKYANFSFEIFQHAVPVEEVRDHFHKANTLVLREDEISEGFAFLELGFQRWVDDCEMVLRDKQLMQKLERMDVMIVDITWPCAMYIKAALEKDFKSTRRRTMVCIAPSGPFGGLLRTMGTPVNIAYQPEVTSGLTNRMSFKERLMNLMMSVMIPIVGNMISTSRFVEMAQRVGLDEFNIHPLHSFADFDLLLLNVQFASDYPFPLTPNIIPVGGLTIRPVQKLSKELEEFVQSSGEHGVVVFSLGTYLASITVIRPDLVRMFSDAFAKLPQKVIWQLKELPDYDLPPNVKTMPWLPQNDLLGHPKTRAFMYQGGNNGFQEASYHGVPVVVIPLHGDQYDVAARIEARGMGKKIDKQDLSTELIYETLTEVINNPSYTTVAKKVSAINKDQPMRAPERAAFWIEHVIKFGGDYMRSPANELNFFQYHLIDVIAFLIAVFVAVLLVLFFTLRFCLRLCCRMIGWGGPTKSKKD